MAELLQTSNGTMFRTRDDVASVKRAEEPKKEASSEFFETPLQKLVFLRTYARWNEKEGRRETWREACLRLIGHFRKLYSDAKMLEERDLPPKIDIEEAVWERLFRNLNEGKVLSSMRAFQFAGPALERNDMVAYNCSYLALDSIKSFVNLIYISMCGTGVGFSCEEEYTNQLPTVKKQGGDSPTNSDREDESTSGTSSLASSKHNLPPPESDPLVRSPLANSRPLGFSHTVDDSREGWADALLTGLTCWFNGTDVTFDYSQVRPRGAKLKTTGGRASGPEPLAEVLNFTREIILAHQGRKLSCIACHDIACKIGECVVSGGVRRTAMISHSDLNNIEMRDAKQGQFFIKYPHRCMANNSAVYKTTPDNITLQEEWIAIMKSGSGERGIVNQKGFAHQIPSRRKRLLGPERIKRLGTNPCGEVILQPDGLCNLTTIVARTTDTEEDLLDKIEVATILGTMQSCLTHFPYVTGNWVKNAKEERLLGVSITGQQDCPAVRNPITLKKLKDKARETNIIWAQRLGINRSSAITLVKPEGTCSEVMNSSSGVHPRFSKFYIRRVRITSTDPLCQFLIASGVPHKPENFQQPPNVYTWVFEFPTKSPEGAVTKDDTTALQALDYWLMVKKTYCEHNPSATISLSEKTESIDVLHWLNKHWMDVGGLSFFPRDDHVYPLAPYEKITEKKYLQLAAEFPRIDYDKFILFEKEDNTEPQGELGCIGDKCDLR